MKIMGYWLLALALSMVLVGYVIAAEPQKNEAEPQKTVGQEEKATGQHEIATAQPQKTIAGQSLQGPQRASQILGMRVNNPDGPIGKIEDLVIGKDQAVKYVILSHGGWLGIGDKLTPIPWKALRWGPDEKSLMVNITKETLKKAPNFDPRKWPDFAKPDWEKQVQVYYELAPTKTAER
jgi:hypothetical protein